MAFSRPTFSALVARVSADMRSRLLEQGKRADPILRRTKMWVLARVYAAIWHVLYETLEWLSKQVLPSTATDIEYLKAFGTAVNIEQKLAQKSTGVVRFTGTNTTVVPSGTEFVSESGAVYVTTSSGTISGGQVDVAARADLAGAEFNLESGAALTLVGAIIGVDDEVTFVSGWDTGTDDEKIEPLRDRILARTRNTPQGGSKADYEMWALEVPGVVRAWCVPLARGAGTVDLYFLHAEGTGFGPPPVASLGGIPSDDQVSEVQEYLDAKRPVTADVQVFKATAVEVDFEIDALTPSTPETQDAIVAQLNRLFFERALTANTVTIHPSELNVAMAQAEGVEGFDMNDPAAAVTASIGEVLVTGVMTYT